MLQLAMSYCWKIDRWMCNCNIEPVTKKADTLLSSNVATSTANVRIAQQIVDQDGSGGSANGRHHDFKFHHHGRIADIGQPESGDHHGERHDQRRRQQAGPHNPGSVASPL